jgi:cytochrome c5
MNRRQAIARFAAFAGASPLWAQAAPEEDVSTPVNVLRTFAAMQQQCRRCHASLSAGHPRTGDAACTSCHRGHTLKT